jgi:hypothetical protein
LGIAEPPPSAVAALDDGANVPASGDPASSEQAKSAMPSTAAVGMSKRCGREAKKRRAGIVTSKDAA